MADGETTKKLSDEVEHALHTASDTVESTISHAKQSIGKVEGKIAEEASVFQSTLESVLGGKKRFWVEQNIDGKRLAINMFGWGAFGTVVHAWHRGIQRTAVFGRPLRPYFIAFPIWTLLGYYIHHFELRQEETVAYRRLLLQRNRGLLEESDFDALRPGQRERHEQRSRLSGLFGKGGEEGQAFLKGSGSEMESYRANLRERLEQFQKDFDESGSKKLSDGELGGRLTPTPYMSELGKETTAYSAPQVRADPSSRKREGSTESSTSRRGFFGLGRKKEPLEDEVERALA
ncbi:hypothetical protein FRC20_003422 [Serendipita sp. 405]|nr:hypothetical protein FRC15_003529 [Serendipita sp. 397]KAG8785838.1 hypothetical protein FRC16_001873 [Serendipita sp. 398]KAG8844690.1 hypothetical protein FRC20_003422 [Serendipita sp. 405]